MEDLKDLLIKRIQRTDDETFLNALKVITDTHASNYVYDLNEFEREKITEARKQIADGDSSTHEDVFKRVDAWIRRK